ncbi:hypothetical protein BDN72DRAFT_954954 [Pluteus cervinus]|uniref:Uncharacterized protein n=1 Tax=Pluteus cervinus TaxID=181527 RepID=A0ACD3BBC6_9AGAR|nr:hypothetical protein BDN72DRAFT_954954 [Pluteus cervinus]
MPVPLQAALRRRTHAIASSLNSHRLFVYATVSLAAVGVAIANALRNHSNFYSIAIYLSRSSRSVLVLANFGLLVALLCGHLVQAIFFGALRPNEIERLYDRLWFFITESLLAFTIFRDEFDIPFAMMFGFLLFVKSFHWLAGDRIEWMDQRPYPGPSTLFHVRMGTLFIILWTTDLLMFFVAVENTIAHGVGGMVLFASEYGILMASMGNTIAKYLLSTYELHRASRRGGENAPPWENKSMWVFYIELATDFVKLTTYLVFFTIIITFYGLPLNIVRDVYITARSFVSRLRALHRYQTATRNMDQRYPNATEEDMTAMSDRTCIICREEMVLPSPAPNPPPQSDGPNTTPKKLPCGHIFHFHCLRSWLERQQSCPTCRRTVLDTNPPAQRPGGVNQAPQPQNAANPPPPPPGVDVPAPPQNPAGQGGGNPLGNPLDLVNRLFGPPQNQPQPGQAAAPGALPQNADNRQPALVIQYHVQYQPQNHQQNPAQDLQPAPIFQGFYGPGGIWQQWPAPGQQAQNPAPTPTVTAAQPAQEETDQGTTPDIQPAASDHSTAQPNLTPREAAREAALRRLNQIATTSPSLESRTPNHPSRSLSAVDAPNRGAVPFLIPLYDPAPRTSSSTSTPQRGASNHSAASNRDPRYELGSLPDLSQLPPTMSNEQLAAMDKLTREAIDERLRVLEGVSGAVYRCIDELMKLRSALPASQPSLPQENGHSKRPGPAEAGPSVAQPSPLSDEQLTPSSDSEDFEGPEGFVVDPQH